MDTNQIQSAIDTKALAEKAIVALPKQVTLTYIDRGDELQTEQIAQIVGGQLDAAVDSINENFMDNEYESVCELLKEALPDEDEREALENSDYLQLFNQECYDRDNSKPFDDLVRNTGRVMVRFYINDSNSYDENRFLAPDSWRWDDIKVEKEARRIVEATKLDWQKNQENARELVVNATYGGDLCVLAYVELTDIVKVVNYLQVNDRRKVRLTFTNPYLLIHDGFNGSGHDVKVDGDIVIQFSKKNLAIRGIMQLDAKGAGTGYSWSDDIACVIRAAYETPLKIEYYR